MKDWRAALLALATAVLILFAFLLFPLIRSNDWRAALLLLAMATAWLMLFAFLLFIVWPFITS